MFTLELPAPDNPFADSAASEAEPAGRPEPSNLIQKALQQERERVAGVLHDTICQDLTGFHYLASGLALKYQAAAPEAAENLALLANKIQRAGRQLGEFMNTLRGDEAS